VDISGLASLTSVVGSLGIFDNEALADISGLWSVTSVDLLSIYNNPALCQSRVEDFVAECSCGGAGLLSGNDDGC
jgi:hypothetical protein